VPIPRPRRNFVAFPYAAVLHWYRPRADRW
jgi:hypothetical protein